MYVDTPSPGPGYLFVLLVFAAALIGAYALIYVLRSRRTSRVAAVAFGAMTGLCRSCVDGRWVYLGPSGVDAFLAALSDRGVPVTPSR